MGGGALMTPILILLFGVHPAAALIWDHVNPYGRYELDMDSRIPILT
jgi:hypothetical protein